VECLTSKGENEVEEMEENRACEKWDAATSQCMVASLYLGALSGQIAGAVLHMD